MLCFNTERMIAKSEMSIVSGNLIDTLPQNSSIDIFNLQPRTGLESCFRFYNNSNESIEICHIAIIGTRNRFEVSYGTETEFRRKGYMKEALAQLVNWIFFNTREKEIWGLPNGRESEHILQSCGFSYYEPFEEDTSMKWYRIENPFVGD